MLLTGCATCAPSAAFDEDETIWLRIECLF